MRQGHGSRALLQAGVKLVPDFGFIFSAIFLGDAVQLLQTWQTKCLYFSYYYYFYFICRFRQWLLIGNSYMAGAANEGC